MDATRFARLARSLTASGTRRGLLRLIAASPLLGGLAVLFDGDEAAAQGRRKRRKKRHKHGRPGPRHRKRKPRCRAKSRTKTCAGRCGLVRDRCKHRVDCGPCACDATSCPDGCCDAEGTCLPDRDFACGTGGVACAGACLDDGTGATLDPEERELLDLINDHRAAAGLPELVHNAQLAAAAEAHSLDMATRDFFSHINPDGGDMIDRVIAQGYTPNAIGENIGKGFPTAQTVFQAWQNSQGDNANMLRADYTEAGIGRLFSDDADADRLWTAVFARPA